MKPDPTRPLLTVNQAGTAVGVSRRTIYNWIEKGLLELARLPSGRTVIYADSLLRTYEKDPQ